MWYFTFLQILINIINIILTCVNLKYVYVCMRMYKYIHIHKYISAHIHLCLRVCLFSTNTDSTPCITCRQNQYSSNISTLALHCFTQCFSVSALVYGWHNNLVADIRILLVWGCPSNVIICLTAWSVMIAAECSAIQLSMRSVVTGWWTRELVSWKCYHPFLVQSSNKW